MAPGRRGGGPSWRGASNGRGGSGRGRGRGSSEKQAGIGVCRHFLRGSCTYGASCKYSHDVSDGAAAKVNVGVEEQDPAQDAVREDYLDFKNLVRRVNSMDFAILWQKALLVLNGPSCDLQQQVARDLVDERLFGLNAIRQTIEGILRTSMSKPARCFEIASAFLSVVTHQALLNCLSVDTYMGTIYRQISGVSGETSIDLFSCICGKLSATVPAPERAEIIDLVSAALAQVLQRERRVILHGKLPTLLGSLEKVLADFNEDNAGPRVAAAAQRVNGMRRMTGMETRRLASPEVHPGNALPTSVRSAFPMDIVVPGGKHDNDFSDISRIRVMPTMGEITSTHSEFLPSTDLSRPHFHADPVLRHLDCAFRLLRHDTFGTLRDFLARLMAQKDIGRMPAPSSMKEVRAHCYTRACVQHIFIDDKTGMQAVLSFSPPPQVARKTLAETRRWWQESSRLEEGGLLCFVSEHPDGKKLLFLTVTGKNTGNRSEAHHHGLASDKHPPSVMARLLQPTSDDLQHLVSLHQSKVTAVLVNFPGLIPATFVPVLDNLQKMFKEGELAFREWILPAMDGEDVVAMDQIPPPAYARGAAFKFRLNSIVKHGSPDTHIRPTDGEDVLNAVELEARTGLDHGQCMGLFAGLTREYALIQGPPGTGKSYVGVQLVRVLLDHKKEAKLGPVLIICYTNHALDQFLMHLRSVGIERIIRIGSQSQVPELDGFNLRVVSKGTDKTRSESSVLGQNYGEMEKCLGVAKRNLKPIHHARNGPSWDALEKFLLRQHPDIYKQFTGGGDGFVVKGDPFKLWLGDRRKLPTKGNNEGPNQTTVDTALLNRAKQNVYALTLAERWRLASSWSDQMRDTCTARFAEAVLDSETHREIINDVHDEINRRTLLNADIIGVTTTGLARNINVLRHVGSKVIINEEAAEVSEPHVISALFPGIQHLIQIGDHQQLRPQIDNYSLSMETGTAYQLDRSQFERRAMGEPGLAPLPLAQLNVQRRMRPEISRLIKGMYPRLTDHESVKNLPDVVGMRHNVFWLDHNHPEESRGPDSHAKSHSNLWEVEMAVAFVRHLVRQGEYSSTDVALLTPYAGQLQKLRSALSKDFEVFLSDRDLDFLAAQELSENGEPMAEEEPGSKNLEKKQLLKTIRLATVDNFQGEEAKVIIVSLVRSNQDRRVGFLKTENRINVLLSRAQHGMYLIGNARTYLGVKMWETVHGQLAAADVVGSSIPLCCPRHPETPIECSEPEHFVLRSPEGGCNLPCDRRLEACGHKCQAKCHSTALHDVFSCSEPCPRIRMTCNHTCPKLCGQRCGPCMVTVKNVELPCGHVEEALPCHKTLKLSLVECMVPVYKAVPGCGHLVEVPCHEDVGSEGFRCPTRCDQLLPCGHRCPGTCARCRKVKNNNDNDNEDGREVVTIHQACTKTCGRPFSTCNHRCRKLCHDGDECGSCEQRCDVRCPHSACGLSCSRPCAPCIEKCTWSCEHQGSCTMPCAAPCNRLPCDERCKRTLSCGHQCPSFCGEDCPEGFCQACARKADARVDLLEFKAYAEVDLNESPIVVLGCGHFFTGETLDGLVGMGAVYGMDKLGRYSGLLDLAGMPLASSVPSCPDCKRPIRQFATKRYNRVINKAVMDETSKRFLVQGRTKLADLHERLKQAEDHLEKLRQRGFAEREVPLRRVADENYYYHQAYDPLLKIEKEATQLRKGMAAEHQPVKKLLDAVVTLNRVATEGGDLEEKMSSLGINTNASGTVPKNSIPLQPVYDRQVTLGAQLVSIKAQEMMLDHKLSVLKDKLTPAALPGGIPTTSCRQFFRDCEALIAEARDANLLRGLAIPATLSFGRIALAEASYARSRGPFLRREDDEDEEKVKQPGSSTKGKAGKKTREPTNPTDRARELLQDALEMCAQLPDSHELQESIQAMANLCSGPRYETFTDEELAAVKKAMVGGPGGIATHSGHWYNCANGHPFAIGECGMAMELARCPECGAPIGGQNHQAVEGVTRATEMEN